jgi:hypothetical protein
MQLSQLALGVRILVFGVIPYVKKTDFIDVCGPAGWNGSACVASLVDVIVKAALKDDLSDMVLQTACNTLKSVMQNPGFPANVRVGWVPSTAMLKIITVTKSARPGHRSTD